MIKQSEALKFDSNVFAVEFERSPDSVRTIADRGAFARF